MSNTTNKGHVLLGLILGLMVAVFAALIAFMLMTKNTTPINDNNARKDEQDLIHRQSSQSVDPNKSLYSKVPLTPDENKQNSTETSVNSGGHNGTANSSAKANKTSEEAMQNIIENGLSSMQPQKKKKKELPEYIDEYGEKHIGTPTENAISVNKRMPEEKPRKLVEDSEQNPNAEIDPIKNIITDKKTFVDKSERNDVKKEKVIKTKTEKDGIFYVQVGSFKNAEQADRQKSVLLMQGLQSNVSEADREGSIVHRVRLGPYYSKREVDDITKRLNNDGMPYKVIKTND
jgi:cell division protein FtsN